jgi:hypothetical protein
MNAEDELTKEFERLGVSEVQARIFLEFLLVVAELAAMGIKSIGGTPKAQKSRGTTIAPSSLPGSNGANQWQSYRFMLRRSADAGSASIARH